MKSTTLTPQTLVTDTDLAALAGVSARRIRQLAESGDLVRVGRNQFELGASIRAMLDAASGEGASGELVKERTRKVAADATMAELELAKARGEVAPVAEFERVQASSFALIRTNCLNIPSRAVLQLLGETDETTFKRKLRAEIVLALQSAAKAIQERRPSDLEADEVATD